MKSKLFGDKSFYKKTLAIALPIMIQQGLTSIVNLIDNFMVGSLGDPAIAGVATVNQIMSIPTFCLVGATAGIGIYLSQFFGAKNTEKLKETFRFKILFTALIVTAFTIIFALYKEPIVKLFVDKDSDTTYAIDKAIEYLNIIIFTIVPLGVVQLYSSSMRETKHTKIPMITGIIAIIINVILNYILIYGHFGAPKLGVTGAAIATLVARYVEAILLIVIGHFFKKYTFCHKSILPFRLSKDLMKNVVIKATPLLMNEFLWSFGMTALFYAYSERGNLVVNAYNICSAVTNIFFITFSALATAISIMVGNELGAGNIEQAKENSAKLITLGVIISIVVGFMIFGISFIIPNLYNVSEETKQLARYFLWGNAVFMCVYMFNAGCFFTIRSGGASLQAFIFDSGYTWIIQVPIAMILVKLTNLSIMQVFILVQCCDFLKAIVGVFFVKKGSWARNLTISNKSSV